MKDASEARRLSGEALAARDATAAQEEAERIKREREWLKDRMPYIKRTVENGIDEAVARGAFGFYFTGNFQGYDHLVMSEVCHWLNALGYKTNVNTSSINISWRDA